MNTHIRLAFALALAGMIGSASAAGEPGREVYERHCRTCHGGTTPEDSSVGPSLTGIVGAVAGTQASAMHARVQIHSPIVWDRESLRRFLSDPRHEVPGTMIPVRVSDPGALERLLDYLESLR
jgi:cytochrome c